MKKTELLDVINLLKGVGRFGGETLNNLDSYLIFKDGFASVFASSVVVSAALPIGFNAAVTFDEFFKFVSKVKSDEIALTLTDGEILIKSGSATAGFKTADIMNDIPELNISEVEKWMKVPKDFREALRLCQFSIAEDMSYGVLSCAYVKQDGIVASDNVRMTERLFGKKATKGFDFFIPRKIVKPITDFQCQMVGLVNGWIHFKAEDGSFISLMSMMGEYPEYKGMFDVEGPEIVMPPELLTALDLVSVIDSGGEMPLTNICIQNDEIVCRTEGVKAWAEERVKCGYNGDDLSFSTSPQFLKDILPVCRQFIVGENAILIKGENFQHVMAMVK